MRLHGWVRGAAMVVAVLLAAPWLAPAAYARSHVSIGVGIAVPGITVGVGNCWRCGYPIAPPVYYTPAYPEPVYPVPAYYPAPVYYAPQPAYYGYGYYPAYRHHAPRRYYRHGYDRGRYWQHRDHDGDRRHDDDDD